MVIDLADDEAEPRLVAAREAGVQYSITDRGDELFILTNATARSTSRSSRHLWPRRARQLARP